MHPFCEINITVDTATLALLTHAVLIDESEDMWQGSNDDKLRFAADMTGKVRVMR